MANHGWYMAPQSVTVVYHAFVAVVYHAFTMVYHGFTMVYHAFAIVFRHRPGTFYHG